MKKSVFASLLTLLFSQMVLAGSLILNGAQNQMRTGVLSQSQTEITLNIGSLKTTTTDNGTTIELPDELTMGRGQISGPNQTVLPAYTILLAVPENAQLSAFVEDDQSTNMADFKLATADEDDQQWIDQSVTASGFYPDRLFDFRYVGQMRDLHIASLTIYPVQYNTQNNSLKIHDKISIKVIHPGGPIVASGAACSEAFMPIYKGIIANAELLDPTSVTRGQYWFIVNDIYADSVAKLVDWKKAKGFPVKLFTLSSIAANPNVTQIRNFILAQYNTAAIKPDYICLVGDVPLAGGRVFPTNTYNTPLSQGPIDSDNYYTFLLGDDYFPDVFIGRISISSVIELGNYINKNFGYERTPYMADTTWYHQATVVAGSDGGSFYSPIQTKLWCREMMLNHGFTNVDTFFASYNYSPPLEDITASISRGAAFVNYRGYGQADSWVPPYYGVQQLQGLTNGPKYGIMHSIVCATGDFNDQVSPCFGEAWIRLSGRGGPGFIGNTNHYAHTKWTNAIDCGIYWGLFQAGAYTLAQSELMGKMNLYYAFPDYRDVGQEVELYFNSYNDLGDPELNCWTNVPKGLLASFIDTLGLGQNGVDVEVTNTGGAPLENAYVCLWKGLEIFMGQFTGNDGHARFQISPETAGQIHVTVTKPTYKPFEGNINVDSQAMNVGLDHFVIDDDNIGYSSGDGDGLANPGETIELTSILRNFGSTGTAASVHAIISSSDSYVSIISNNSQYGNISFGDSATSITPYVIYIREDAPDNYSVPIAINISEESGVHWQSYILLPIKAANLNVLSSNIQADNNNNQQLDPGETAQLILQLRNIGPKVIRASQAILRCSDSQVSITDSIGVFGDIDTGGIGTNTTDPFVVGVTNEIYVGHQTNFTLIVTGSGGITRTLVFPLTVGVAASSDPIGPDDYGYYCFDNSDVNYLMRPTYAWVPIDTTGNYVNIQDDTVQTVSLPFQVKYYGQIYNQVSICDNGYIAFGQTWWANFQNAQIPGPQCAPAMVAPFWDDLKSGSYTPLKVYYKYDSINGTFCIGWKRAYDEELYQWLTFEIVILDHDRWPTRTGDNEIIFQYNSVTNCTGQTVGICNQDKTIGLQYQFDEHCAPGAVPLESHQAIKFTTGSDYVNIIDDNQSLPNNISLHQNYPNPFNMSTMIEFELSKPGNITLDVFDILGRKVVTLLSGALPSGKKQIIWNGASDRGEIVSAGIYFYKLKTADGEFVKRMLLLK